jgi:hypothetical protein
MNRDVPDAVRLRANQRDPLRSEVDVRPAEANDLGPSHPRHHRRHSDRAHRVWKFGQQSGLLVALQRADAPGWLPKRPNATYCVRGLARHPVPVRGHPHEVLQRREVSVHSARSAALSTAVTLEPFDPEGLDLVQVDVAQRGHELLRVKRPVGDCLGPLRREPRQVLVQGAP